MRLLPTPVVAPAAEPVTVSEVKLDCRIEDAETAFDQAIPIKIAAARQAAEKETGRKLITQTTRDELGTRADVRG